MIAGLTGFSETRPPTRTCARSGIFSWLGFGRNSLETGASQTERTRDPNPLIVVRSVAGRIERDISCLHTSFNDLASRNQQNTLVMASLVKAPCANDRERGLLAVSFKNAIAEGTFQIKKMYQILDIDLPKRVKSLNNINPQRAADIMRSISLDDFKEVIRQAAEAHNRAVEEGKAAFPEINLPN